MIVIYDLYLILRELNYMKYIYGFLLGRHNKLWIVHVTYRGVAGYNGVAVMYNYTSLPYS